MTIKVTHIRNHQAIKVNTPRSHWDNWRIFFGNSQRFNYENARLNRQTVATWSDEAREAFQGDY